MMFEHPIPDQLHRHHLKHTILAAVYHVFYLFRVPVAHVDRFCRIARDASAVYRRHGAQSVSLRITEAAGKYGCLGLLNEIDVGAEEQLFLGIDSFPDEEQFHALMALIDADAEINVLYREIQEVVDLARVIRWEGKEMR
jgi:uncharacterized protein YbaA (DUF1428 family)